MQADEITEAFADWHRALKRLSQFEAELVHARAHAKGAALKELEAREKMLVAECDAALARTTALLKGGRKDTDDQPS